jgi:hypothetical protein
MVELYVSYMMATIMIMIIVIIIFSLHDDFLILFIQLQVSFSHLCVSFLYKTVKTPFTVGQPRVHVN